MTKTDRAPLHPNIHRLVASQALSRLGDNFTEVALALFVLALMHHSVAALGVVLAMTYLPHIVLGWAVMGIVDRINKRAALAAADLGRAVLVASIPLVHTYDWTVAAVFLMYTFSVVYRPILRGVQPQISGDMAVNRRSGARQQTYYAIADVGAYLAAAGVLFLWGIRPAFWIDAATYVGAFLLVMSIRVAPAVWNPRSETGTNFKKQLAEGYRYVKNDALIAQLTLISTAATLGVGALNTFTAPLSRSIWHVTSQHYVWLLLALAVGGLVAGWALERFELMDRWGFRTLIAGGFGLTGVGYGLSVAMPSWWGALALFAVVGFGNGLFGTAVVTWIQQATPDDVRARVLSMRGIGLGLGGALGAWAGGLAAQSLGLTTAVVMVGGLWLVLAFWTVSVAALRASQRRGSAA